MKRLRTILDSRAAHWPARGLLGLALLGGCSDPDDERDASLDDLASCGASRFVPCDVLDPACQARLAEIVACQWGGPGTAPVLPPVTTLTEQEVAEQLRAESAEAMDPEPAAYDDVLAAFGLIEPGGLGTEASIARTTEGLLALYEFETKNIIIVERDEQMDPGYADATLFHELVHAQQDAAHDLGAIQTDIVYTTDGILSFQNLTEGEAQFQENVFLVGLQRGELTPGNLEAGQRYVRQFEEGRVFSEPSVLPNAILIMPYLYGPSWISNTWVAGGTQAVQGRYRDVPADTLEILSSTWRQAVGPVNSTPFPLDETATEGERLAVSSDRLGAYGVYVAARLFGNAGTADELALGWRGDQLDAYTLDAGGSAGRWLLDFDTPTQAARFSGLLATNTKVQTRVDGSRAVAVVAPDGQAPEWLFGPLGNQ